MATCLEALYSRVTLSFNNPVCTWGCRISGLDLPVATRSHLLEDQLVFSCGLRAGSDVLTHLSSHWSKTTANSSSLATALPPLPRNPHFGGSQPLFLNTKIQGINIHLLFYRGRVTAQQYPSKRSFFNTPRTPTLSRGALAGIPGGPTPRLEKLTFSLLGF